MPNYDYRCVDCGYLNVRFEKYDDRDNLQICEVCAGVAERCFATPPQIRTEKLSRTFVDGTKREGYADLKRAAELEVEKLKHKPGSQKYHELNAEIQARRAIRPNNNKYALGKPDASIKPKKEEK